MEKLHKICHVLWDKEDKKGVTFCIFSLWAKVNSLIKDNPIDDKDYHPGAAIYDVAYDIMEMMEDVQTYAQDIVLMLRPLIKLNPEFEEDGFDDDVEEG